MLNNKASDICYATKSLTQKLDVYLPGGGNHPYPVILWLHPGGFSRGDKTDLIDLIIPPLLEREYAVVGVNYRLSGEAKFPAQIFDAKEAVRWIRANAVLYHFNPDKIAAWGCSAGSTLAALLGTSAEVKELEDLTLGNSTQSSRVSAVVDWYGPIDFLQMDAQLVKLGYKPVHDTVNSVGSDLIGGPPSQFPEKYKAVNPINYITREAVPFYIQHGKSDRLVPYLQSLMLAEALRSAIGQEKVVLEIIENAGHFDGVHQSEKNIEKILDFLDKFLK
jgi:acetyl esterase/lipase